MCRIIKVTGESLTPLFEEGDFVLVLKIPFLSLNSGDTIVFRHDTYGTMIKQIEDISPRNGTVRVIGTHPRSQDSRSFGPVARKDIIGKVIWHIKQKH